MSKREGHLGNAAAQGKLRAAQRLQAEQQADDLRAVLATSEGRRFVWRLLDVVAGVNAPSFTGEPQTTSYREGRRAVGIELMVECQRVDPANFVHMLTEELARRDAAAANKAVAETTPDPETPE